MLGTSSTIASAPVMSSTLPGTCGQVAVRSPYVSHAVQASAVNDQASGDTPPTWGKRKRPHDLGHHRDHPQQGAEVGEHDAHVHGPRPPLPGDCLAVDEVICIVPL